MKLRSYQQAAIDAAYRMWKGGARRVLLTMATGVGKSIVFKKAAVDAASRSRRVLLLVEGQDLVEQAANHMRTAGLRVAVEMADQRVDTRGHDLIGVGPEVVVASVDSMVRRTKNYPADFFGLIICDETHHAAARSYRVVFGHFGLPVPRDPEDGSGKYPDFGGCLLLGLTATPDRTDKKTLVPDIYEDCAFEYSILQAVEDGWLVRPEERLCHLPGYDLSKVRTVAGDLNASDLADVLEPLVTPMVEKVLEIADGRRTLIYSVLK
ncbi:MAG: DEAD/DEAH box helicase family protein [Rhodospirillaceae bacterium]